MICAFHFQHTVQNESEGQDFPMMARFMHRVVDFLNAVFVHDQITVQPNTDGAAEWNTVTTAEYWNVVLTNQLTKDFHFTFPLRIPGNKLDVNLFDILNESLIGTAHKYRVPSTIRLKKFVSAFNSTLRACTLNLSLVLCVCVHVCMCTCVCAHLYAGVCMCVCVCVCVCIYRRVEVCVSGDI
jgi:hypothetical protein